MIKNLDAFFASTIENVEGRRTNYDGVLTSNVEKVIE